MVKSITISIVAALAAACSPNSQFLCHADEECNLEPGGRCLATSSCAYPDPSCDQGWRADSVCVEPTFPDAAEPPAVDASDASMPERKLWALLAGNARSDRTIPDAPVPKEPIVIYRPGAHGYEVAWTSNELDWVRDVVWGDYDGDGRLDFGVGIGWLNGRRNRIYHNTGNGWDLVWTAPTAKFTQAVAWLDGDGDGKLDLVAAVKGSLMMYRNEGGGIFTERELLNVKGSAGFATTACSIALADFDHDGDVDLALGTDEGPRVYANNGGGVFVQRWSTPASGCGPVAWADYDHDGDEDVTVAGLVNAGAEDTEIFAYAAGAFTKAWSLSSEVRGLDNTTTTDIAWLDVDGDGDLDLALSSMDFPPGGGSSMPSLQRVYRNSGGSFSVAWTLPAKMLAYTVAAADFDNDGKPDLAFGGDGQSVLLHNLGATFEQAWASERADFTMALGWAPFPLQ